MLGAAGGVGLAAVELGKAMGARVIAAASSAEKLQVARDAGADEVIDYSDGELKDKVKALTNGKGADVIYDPVGGSLFDQCMRCVNWYGRVLVVGFVGGDIPRLPTNLVLLKSCQVVGVFYGAFSARYPADNQQNFKEIMDMFAAGTLQPLVGREFNFEQYVDALNCLEQRQAIGQSCPQRYVLIHKRSTTMNLDFRQASTWASLNILLGSSLLAGALFFEFILGLPPCPLCMMQRLWFILAISISYVGLAHNPKWGIYPLLTIMATIGGGYFAAKHLWLQSLPADQVPACGPDLAYMLDVFPLSDVLIAMTTGTGDCATTAWSLFGITLPGLGIAGLYRHVGLRHWPIAQSVSVALSLI